MAKKRIRRRRRKRQKNVATSTPHAPLCALGTVLEAEELFAPIHQLVQIDQKIVDYRPTDKLVFALLGILAGAESVYDINTVLRPNKPLLAAFGYDKCADQSVIQQTLNAATEKNIAQLETAQNRIWEQKNRIRQLWSQQDVPQRLTLDIDLSPLPASKRAENSRKGYASGKKNSYNRQLARVLVSKTSEIVTQTLYPGNTLSLSVFKEIVQKMEAVLQFETKDQRRQILLRIDAGFGTDQNINWALWRGYHVLAKLYSGRRAKKLAQSVSQWVEVPSQANKTKRQAGFVKTPHRYGRKTVQVAVRTLTNKGQYSYSVLVTTQLDASLAQIVTDYDKRSGVAESTFCQDYQGLKMRHRRKGGFVAQQVLVILSQIAHNLMIWIKNALVSALEESLGDDDDEPDEETVEPLRLAIKILTERGLKRFLRQILHLSGSVVFWGKKVVCLYLNPFYPFINRIRTAFEAFLKPYKIRVLLDEN